MLSSDKHHWRQTSTTEKPCSVGAHLHLPSSQRDHSYICACEVKVSQAAWSSSETPWSVHFTYSGRIHSAEETGPSLFAPWPAGEKPVTVTSQLEYAGQVVGRLTGECVALAYQDSWLRLPYNPTEPSKPTGEILEGVSRANHEQDRKERILL